MLDDSNKDNGLAYRHAGIWIGTTQHLKLKCAMEKRELTKLADGEHETILRDRHGGSQWWRQSKGRESSWKQEQRRGGRSSR